MGNGLSDYRQEDMLSIVMKLAEQYVSGDSTSITYERAQSLMDAVLYCINEYEHADDGNFVRAEMTAGEVYELGFRLVQDKARKVRGNYHRLMAGLTDIMSERYSGGIIWIMSIYLKISAILL